jgi:hypothetical protein
VDWAYLKSALVWIIPPTLVGVFGLIALPDAAPPNPRPVRTNPAHIKIKLTKNNSVLEKITRYLSAQPPLASN